MSRAAVPCSLVFRSHPPRQALFSMPHSRQARRRTRRGGVCYRRGACAGTRRVTGWPLSRRAGSVCAFGPARMVR